MLKQVKNRILAFKKAAGIELTFLSDGSFIINCIVLEVVKGKAVVAKTYYNLKSIDSLAGEISESTPVALIINGKGVIHKRTNSISDNLPADIFPGVNPNDFLFQYSEELEVKEIAVIRKNIAEKIIAELDQIKINIVSLSIAFYDLAYISKLINHTGNIPTTQYNIDFSDSKIRQYTFNSDDEKGLPVKPEINIDTIYIKSNFLIPYASAIKLLMQGFNNGGIKLDSIVENQKKISQAVLLKVYTLSLLALFLCLLLLNFFVYNHYYSKNNELLSLNQFSLQQKSRFDSLNKSVNIKKEFLAKTGWIDSRRMISFYADRIAATVPDSVTLTSLNIFPAASKLTNSIKQWAFQQDTLLVNGECNDPSLLDDWLKEISKIKNVKQSKIISYLFKKQGQTGTFSAEVIVK